MAPYLNAVFYIKLWRDIVEIPQVVEFPDFSPFGMSVYLIPHRQHKMRTVKKNSGRLKPWTGHPTFQSTPDGEPERDASPIDWSWWSAELAAAIYGPPHYISMYRVTRKTWWMI
jgi:hypothetical protein